MPLTADAVCGCLMETMCRSPPCGGLTKKTASPSEDSKGKDPGSAESASAFPPPAGHRKILCSEVASKYSHFPSCDQLGVAISERFVINLRGKRSEISTM